MNREITIEDFSPEFLNELKSKTGKEISIEDFSQEFSYQLSNILDKSFQDFLTKT